MAFLRLFIGLILVLSVVYGSLYYLLLARRRERVERDYQDGAGHAERARFVAAKVETYGRRIRRPLAIAVYAVPLAALLVYIWVSN